jgi:hypothetical protein
MSALEVLQTCPSQRNALLSALGALEPSGSKFIKFDVTDVNPHLPYHVAFQIHVEYSNYTIKRVVVDEGVATCVMSLVYWKSLSYPTISKSSNMLNSFDGHFFRPRGILLTFSIQLGENIVEVVDAPLDYNMLLGRNCTYVMIIVSFIFCTLCFPHEGKIVTIDQLSFVCSSPNAYLGPSIPVINNSQTTTENIGVGMYSSLMGTFKFVTPSHHIYAMSSRPVSTGRSIHFRTSYFSDPWTLPSSTSPCEGQPHTGIISPTSISHVGDWSTTSTCHVEYQQPATTTHVGGTSLVIASHTAHTSPTSVIHVGDSSPTSARHVGDLLLPSTSHVGNMSPATTSHAGGIHTIENPRHVRRKPKFLCRLYKGDHLTCLCPATFAVQEVWSFPRSPSGSESSLASQPSLVDTTVISMQYSADTSLPLRFDASLDLVVSHPIQPTIEEVTSLRK